MLIGSNLYRDKSINNLADLLDEAAVEIQKLNTELVEAHRNKAEVIEYAQQLIGGHLVILNFATSSQKADEYAKKAITLAKPKCME